MVKPRLAIIGATGFATERMIPEVLSEKNAEIVAVQARNTKKLDSLCDKFAIPVKFTNVESMIRQTKPTVLYIATPPFLHEKNIQQIAKYNIPIICEKPLAQNMSSARKIAKLCQKNKLKIVLGHHIRHQPAIKHIKELIEKKDIGDVIFVQGQWGYPIDPKSNLAKWKFNPDKGGKSVFGDPGIHLIDLCIALFGKPMSVVASGFSKISHQTYDNASGLLNYKKCTIALNNSQTMSDAFNDLTIYGTKGSITVPNGISQESIPVIIVHKNGKQVTKKFKKTNLYAKEIDAINGKCAGLHPTSFQEGMTCMRILELIEKSIETGRRYKL